MTVQHFSTPPLRTIHRGHIQSLSRMALVAGYSSDEDEDYSGPTVAAPSTSTAATKKTVHAAPEVSLEVHALS